MLYQPIAKPLTIVHLPSLLSFIDITMLVCAGIVDKKKKVLYIGSRGKKMSLDMEKDFVKLSIFIYPHTFGHIVYPDYIISNPEKLQFLTFGMMEQSFLNN